MGRAGVNAVDKKCEPHRNGCGPAVKIMGESSGWNAGMESYQWFLLGVMVAWTPGLLVLALMLRRRNIGHDQRGGRHRTSPAQAMDVVQIDRRATGRVLKS